VNVPAPVPLPGFFRIGHGHGHGHVHGGHAGSVRNALVTLILVYSGAALAQSCPSAPAAVDQRAFVCAAQAEPAATTLNDVLARLPMRFRKNFTLKHGARRPGERGHVQDAVEDSPSARPAFPRVIMWDETTGFSISYDGSTPAPDAPPRAQRGAHRLGMLSVDKKTGAFSLSAIELPGSLVPGQPAHPDDQCVLCHGPDSRPIWPMYPDWPGFVGGDNDELSRDTPTQREEMGWLQGVRKAAATPGDRLAALFAPELEAWLAGEFGALDPDALRAYLLTAPRPSAGLKAAATGDDATLRRWLGLELHERFPYRANHELQLAEASRAMFHRPNSRVGILYNRLQARRLLYLIRKSPVYRAFPELVTLTVMDCGWPGDAEPRARAYTAFGEAAKAELAAREMPPPAPDAERILYPVLLASLGLSVRDVDLRLAHRSHEFDRFDRAYAAPTTARTVMDLGYLDYPSPSVDSGAVRFWSSYFDGSASLDELLAAGMLADLAAKDRGLAALYKTMSLAEKYQETKARLVMDGPFFASMDRLGRWFPLPFPDNLLNVHHRDPFAKAKPGRATRHQFPAQYHAVCERLRLRLAGAPVPTSPSGGK